MKRSMAMAAAAWLILVFALLSFTACDDDDDNDAGGADDDDDDNDDNDDDDDTSPGDTFSCEALGLPVRPWEDAESVNAMYATAADFTVNTTVGSWNFKASWTGCETYLFIQDKPRQCAGWSTDLWERDVAPFLHKLPDNAHVFFLSTYDDPDNINASLNQVKVQADEYLAGLTAEEQAAWARRLHYVTDSAAAVPGWLGEIMTDPRWGAAVDRFQRIRYIGSYADPMRYDSGAGWFEPNLKMAANESIYYNFEAEREAALEAEGATVLTVFEGEEIAAGLGYADVTFPGAATMAAFDTMELDLYLGCVGEGEYGTCPAWDYIVSLYLCEADEPDICTLEIGRWITTYHREGRWVHDISGLLPLLADGGTRRLAFYTQQPYEVFLYVRLADAGEPVRPQSATYLFTGGAFDPNYNNNFVPLDVPIPGDAVKVELATVITGHGGASPGNCAEFCNTTHHFLVNGQEYVLDFPQAGDMADCMDKAAEGTVPNQYGTWWYGRSGWCPGKEVQMVMTDVTASINAGQDNTFEYFGLYMGAPYPSGGASIDMTSWVVVSK